MSLSGLSMYFEPFFVLIFMLICIVLVAIFKKPQKQKEIINILNTYPDLSFILIGDAGEKDAEIYMETVAQFPNRIKAIYLRSVSKTKNNIRIKNLIKNYTDTEFLLVNNSDEAIAHAKKHKFIT